MHELSNPYPIVAAHSDTALLHILTLESPSGADAQLDNLRLGCGSHGELEGSERMGKAAGTGIDG
ncbi:hypothetical protein VE03_03006 [Pseudogymnoascus sp. 23342-1-I1]|nr:hypothetical protein VE03_03006 [Pseudogymnoascus sp. 23342-1-I1]